MGKGKCLNREKQMICCCSSQCCVICIAIFNIVFGFLQFSSWTGFSASVGSESKSKGSSSTADSTTLTSTATSSIVGGIFTMGIGIVLLVGVCMKSTFLLKIFMIVTLIHILYAVVVIIVILVVALTLYGVSEAKSGSDTSAGTKVLTVAGLIISSILIFFLSIALDLYFLLCVRQYKNELLETPNMGAVYYPSQAHVNYQTRAPSLAPSQQGTSLPSKELEP